MARIDFADWLKQQLAEKGWKVAELARRSGVTPSYLSRVIRGERYIGHEAAKAIAGPMGLTVSEIKIAAGLEKPTPPTDTPEIKEINEAFAYLSPDEQAYWAGMLKCYVAERRREYSARPQDKGES